MPLKQKWFCGPLLHAKHIVETVTQVIMEGTDNSEASTVSYAAIFGGHLFFFNFFSPYGAFGSLAWTFLVEALGPSIQRYHIAHVRNNPIKDSEQI